MTSSSSEKSNVEDNNESDTEDKDTIVIEKDDEESDDEESEQLKSDDEESDDKESEQLKSEQLKSEQLKSDDEESSDEESSDEAVFEEVVIKVEPVGNNTFISQMVEINDDEVVVKATPVTGDGLVEAFNTIIVNSFDDRVPVLKLNEIQHGKLNRSRDRLTTVENSSDYHCMMLSEDVSEVDDEPLSHLVDFIKEYAPTYGMMHNDLHLGNVVYNMEADTLTMIGLSKMSFFKNIESIADISGQVEDTLLQDESYVDNRSFDMNSIRAFQMVDEENDGEKAVVYRRYLPDLMTLSMYMYTKTIRHHPDMTIPIFKKAKTGQLIGQANLNINDIDIHTFWEPVLEGILAYAAYTQNMYETRDQYFKIYTPLGTTHAKIHLEKFLNDYNSFDSTDYTFFNDDKVHSDLYCMLFPQSLEEAHAKKWRTVRSKEHISDVLAYGGLRYGYASNTMLFATSLVCTIIGSMSW